MIVVTSQEKAAQCVSLLFGVLVQGNGDVAVLHTGEKPRMAGPAGARVLAHEALSSAAMRNLLRELLSEEERTSLTSVGATRTHIFVPDFPYEHFTIEARLVHGAPIVEVHRVRVPEDDYVPPEAFSRKATTRRPAAGDDGLTLPQAADLWLRDIPA